MNIKDLLKVMVDQDASDIYITVDAPPVYRIQGVTRPLGKATLEPMHTQALSYSIMNEKQRAEFEETHEMNLALYYPELGRFRVNVFRQRGFIGMVIRQIKIDIMTIDGLKLPPILKDLVMMKRGLILMVGATGCGKSTTLAAMVEHRNTNTSGHIVTIEDPVEFIHRHNKSIITQREVGMDTLSFKLALKNTLRQAPDVILIGEMRDTETMEHAIEFAETGHLCMGTLHANNANQALERVLNFFPEDRHPQILLQLSLNLRAIVSQRLIPTVDEKRAAAVEILVGTPRVQDLIAKGEVGVLRDVMEKGTQEGMQTFDQALFLMYKAGEITLENALANSDSPNNLRLKIKMDSLVETAEEKETVAEKKFQLDS